MGVELSVRAEPSGSASSPLSSASTSCRQSGTVRTSQPGPRPGYGGPSYLQSQNMAAACVLPPTCCRENTFSLETETGPGSGPPGRTQGTFILKERPVDAGTSCLLIRLQALQRKQRERERFLSGFSSAVATRTGGGASEQF